MNFLYPSLLYASALIAVPIIIHLFNFRRHKKIYFTNVRFLKELNQQTQSRSRLKHLLVLIARCLAVLFIVMAFAQPYIPVGTQKIRSSSTVCVYIDNSFSMNALGKNGTLLNEAKSRARELVKTLKSPSFRILTNDFLPRHLTALNKEQAIAEIDQIKETPLSRSFQEVQDRLHKFQEPTETYILSDFQLNFFRQMPTQADTVNAYFFIPLSSQLNRNLYIDTCYFKEPVIQLDQPAVVYAKLVNLSSAEAKDVPVKLFVDNTQKGIATATIPAGGSVLVPLNFTITQGGWKSVKVEIKDYPVIYDDSYYLSFNILGKVSVLTIGAPNNPYLSAFLKNDPFINAEKTSENQVNYSALGEKQVVILNELSAVSTGLAEELNKFVEKGGSLVVLPALNANLAAYNEFLHTMKTSSLQNLQEENTKIDKIETRSFLYKNVFEKVPENVDLPLVKKYFKLSPSLTREERLLLLQNKDPFLSVFFKGKGKIYLFSAPLNTESNAFGEHSLFVSTFYNIVLYSTPVNTIESTIGNNEPIEISTVATGGDQVFHVKSNRGFDIIPEHRSLEEKTYLYLNNQINEADNYSVITANRTVSEISFNYSRKESDLRQYSPSQLEELRNRLPLRDASILSKDENQFQKAVLEIYEGHKLWKLFIIIALLFLLSEIMFIKFMK